MSDKQTTVEPLYTNEEIAWYADNSATAWEAKRIYDAMVKVRDFYEAELAKARAELGRANARIQFLEEGIVESEVKSDDE